MSGPTGRRSARVIVRAVYGRLQVAQLVTIEGDEDSSRPRLSFIVVESSDTEVVLKAAGPGELLRTIMPGQKVRLSTCDSTGIHRTNALVKHATTDPDPGVVLVPPQVFHTTQNRNFFRVYTSLPAPYRILSSTTEAAVGQEDREAFTQDISAGGIRLWTLRPLLVGDRVRVRVVCSGDEEAAPVKSRPPATPSEGRTVLLDADVLRIERIPITKKTCYTVGARFVDLSVREQDRLVGLMFDLQRRLRNP